jgi:hypothetical protein
MPLNPGSRYQGLETYEAADANGRPQATVAIRPAAPPTSSSDVYSHVLVAGESLEYLAWRYYGSSTSWWRLADTGPAVFPLDITPGAVVAVPSSDAVGRVERTRRF